MSPSSFIPILTLIFALALGLTPAVARPPHAHPHAHTHTHPRYWQLNAIWQGPDWSTLEYDGRLRLSHHVVRRVFAPIMLSTTAGAGGALGVHLINDSPYTGVEATLRVRVHAWGAAPHAAPHGELNVLVHMPPAGSRLVWSGDPMQLVADRAVHRSQVFVRAELLSHHGGADAGGAADGVDNAHERAPLASTDHWMADWRVIELPRGTAQIVRAERAAPTAARLLVRANTTLAFVTVECSSVVGAFSDAGFTLLAGEERLLDFRARAPFELGAFTDGLHVRSLRDTYS